jgi:hypothetical protein
MAKTPNHEYSKPARGTENWDQPINDNFGALDVDIEIRDVAANRSTYDPVEGAKFLATDTGVVSVGVSGSTGPVWTPVFVLPGYRSSGAGTDAVFDVPVTVTGLTVGAGVLDLDGSSLVDSAGVNDSVTVAGNSVALGGSTAIAHADLDSVTSDQHHAEDHDHTGGISVVPNAGLANSSVTVAGQTVSLGGSTDVDYVDLGDTGGSFPIANADIANSSVTVSAGTGLTGGGATSLGNSTTLGITPGGVGTTELDTPFVDLPTLFGDPVSVGGTLQASGALTVATNGGDRALELGVPRSDGTGSTAGGNVLAGSPSNSIAPLAVGGVVAGGGSSTSANEVSAAYGTVSGGQGNTASGEEATVGGGQFNTASGDQATVGGGQDNTASGLQATVGGGNSNTASGFGATVPGGNSGAAEDDISFVLNDGTGYHPIPNSNFDGLSSNTAVDGEPVTGAYTFSVSAGNGVRFITGGASDPNVTYVDESGTFVPGGNTVGAPAGESLALATDDGTRALELGVPGPDSVGNTAGGNVLAGSPNNSISGAVGAVIAGGGSDTAANEVSADYGAIGGGRSNTASGQEATVGGGRSNTASGQEATVTGGQDNVASAQWATVGGGRNNTASGEKSFAAGQNAKAVDELAFVWNDGTRYHDIDGTSPVDGLSSGQAVDGEPVTGSDTFSVSAGGGVRFITGSTDVTYIAANSAGWSTTSSRAVKTNIDPVDPAEALAGVEEMEVATWEYTDDDGEGAGTTHIGPMAEEFHDAFDVGASDEHINSINADGVAFAAIQGLSAKLDEREERIESQADRINELETENETLRERNAELEDRLAAVEDRLAAIENQSSPAPADD